MCYSGGMKNKKGLLPSALAQGRWDKAAYILLIGWLQAQQKEGDPTGKKKFEQQSRKS